MNRKTCPQLRGVYESFLGENQYKYVLIKQTNPDGEYCAIDAFPCRKNGELLEGWRNGGVVHRAEDVGVYCEKSTYNQRIMEALNAN